MVETYYSTKEIGLNRRDFLRLAAFSATSVIGGAKLVDSVNLSYKAAKLNCVDPEDQTDTNTTTQTVDCLEKREEIDNRFLRSISTGTLSTLAAISLGLYGYANRLHSQLVSIHPDILYRHSEDSHEVDIFVASKDPS